jgi:TRAP-type C4-dicarboxylate transport system substrate-binding protein
MITFLALSAVSTTAMAQEVIRLRIASGHPPANTYVNLMQNFFVPEVTKRVAEKTKFKVEFVEGYGGAMVKVADTLEGVQAGIIDIGGYCFCFEPSNLPLHAFQVMLPFGTMDPTVSLKVARAVYDKVPYMSKVFEDKFKQKLIALIADNGYNLGTNFEWNSVADIKGQKIAGAGLNLKWLEFAGATPVQSSLPDAYTSMQTGVLRLDHVPVGLGQLQAPEVRRFYTESVSVRLPGTASPSIRRAGRNCRRTSGHHPEVAKGQVKTGTVNRRTIPSSLPI